MPIFRRFLSFIAVLAIATTAVAQSEHHHMTIEEWRAFAASISTHGEVIPQPAIAPEAVKTITITASCSGSNFSFNPNTFTVNQGDVVTIKVTVPPNDCSSIGHGFLMSTYHESGTNVGRGSTVTIPMFTATTVGQFGYVCTQPNCGVGHSNMFGIMNVVAVVNPAPTVASIAPTSGTTAGGTAVTITGTNFSSSTVSIGGVAATGVNVVSSTTITATTPAHAAGAVDVKVTNGDGQFATLTNGFTFNAPSPTIASVAPSSGPVTGGTAITITGTNFQNGAMVSIGESPATNVVVVSATQITATTPANAGASLIKDVTVRNPDATTVTKNAAFTYVASLTATGVYPEFGSPSGGTMVTISGSGFQNGATVSFGESPGTSVTVVDSSTIRVTAPAHAAGPVSVSVTLGATTVKVINGFTYTTATPRRRAAGH